MIKTTNDMKFAPNHVPIHVGDRVEWKNTSVLVHTATDMPGLASNPKDAALPQGAKGFNSGNLAPGATYRHTFSVPGTYRYFCIPHEAAGMLGTIVVTR